MLPKNSIIYKTFGNKANDSKLGASCSPKILLYTKPLEIKLMIASSGTHAPPNSIIYKTFGNKANDSKFGASCSPKILLYTKPLEIKLMIASSGPHAPQKFYYIQNLWK